MKTYIYMNDKIKDKSTVDSKTPEPVITVQQGKTRIYCNNVRVKGPSNIKFGTLKAHGHDVRAWVETNSKVEVIQ